MKKEVKEEERKLFIEITTSEYKKIENGILQGKTLKDATDEDLVDELLKRTSGELNEYLDPSLKQKVKVASGKLVTRKMVAKYTIIIKTDM